MAMSYELERIAKERSGYTDIGSGSVVDLTRADFKRGCKLAVGDSSMVSGQCIFDREGAQIEFGSRTYFHGRISCAQHVRIGDDVLISDLGLITDHQSHAVEFAGRANDVVDWISGAKDWSNVSVKPVTIESKVWIGFNVIILSGVTIGEGAVIGAGSVVTRDVAPYTVMAGNPARVIRSINGFLDPDAAGE